MAKYNAKGVYSVLFSTVDNFSKDDQKYLFDTKFTDEFIDDIKNDPKKAYNVLNEIVQNIEDGKTDRISKMFKDYADKIYIMKNMLKDYGGFYNMSVEVGKCFDNIQDLIDVLEKIKYEYGNDTPIKIINPIDHNYVGNAKFEGIGKDGSLILSGLYIFGMTNEEIDKRVDKFVEENQEEPMGVFDTDEEVELELQTTDSYNRGLEDGYRGCLLDILTNMNVEKK